MKQNTTATNFEPHEHVIFVQSAKIYAQENKAIHSISQNKCVNAWFTNNIINIDDHTKCLYSVTTYLQW